MNRSIRLAAGLVAAASLTTACGRTHPVTSPSPARIPALSAGAAAAPALGVAEPIAPFPGRVEYRVRGTLPALPSQAAAYRLGATATDAQVSRLASALGVHGAASNDASGWTVTGSTEVLRVERTAGIPWNLMGSGGAGAAGSGCAVAVPVAPALPPGGRLVLPPCAQPTAVPALPSRAQAEQLVRTDLQNAGLDLAGATVEASGGITEWFVSVIPAVDGVPLAAAPWSAGVGPHGSLLSASGWLATPASAGDYPLVGVSAGLDRLEKGGWVLLGGPGPIPVPLVGAAGGVSNSGSVAAPPPQAVPPAAPVAPLPPPAPVPAGPPCATRLLCLGAPPSVVPPPTVLTVTGVHLGLAWGVPAGNGDGAAQAWLVPVYVFELDGGGTIPVLAVTDRFVDPPSTIIAP